MNQLPDQYSYGIEPSSPRRPESGTGSPVLPAIDLAGIFMLLLRRWWIILLGMLVAGGAGFAYLSRQPEIFRSYAVIYVGKESDRILQIQQVAPNDYREMEELKTVEQSIVSSSVILRVIEANGLREDPTFAPPAPGGGAWSDAVLVEFLGNRVGAALRRGTRLIDIAVEDTDPERARRLAESFVEEFTGMSYEQQLAATLRAKQSLMEEKEKLKERLMESECRLQDFRKENPDLPLENDENMVLAKLNQLNEQLSAAKAERLRLQTDVEQLEGVAMDNPEKILQLGTVAQQNEVVALRTAINEKEAEFAKIRKRYRSKHPTYISIETELNGLHASLEQVALESGESIRRRYEAALENEAKLVAAVEEQSGVAIEMEDALVVMQALQREVESDQALLDSVVLRLKETGVSEGIEASNIRSVEAPMVAARPVKPRKKVILAVALVLGCGLGAGLILLIELLDGSLRTATQTERALGVPALASIPGGDFPDLETSVVLRSNPNSPIAESFRMLRTSLSFMGLQGPSRSVLFTSAMSNEGKSFCALNYAVALASQGYRTLLIDADLRRPSLGQVFLRDADAVGLSDHLDGRIEPGQGCFETEYDNLYFLSAGHAKANAPELLGDERFPRLIAEAYRWFDRVIIDSSPVGVVSDALTLSRCVQSVCLVVRSGKTQRKDAAKACRYLQMAGAPLVGFVLNDVESKGMSESYYRAAYPDLVREPVLALTVNS